MALSAGTTLGSYQVTAKIGEGAWEKCIEHGICVWIGGPASIWAPAVRTG